jgi:phosphatidylinositol dimannoside acyltransferase
VLGTAFALALPVERRRVRDNLRWALGERPALVEGRDVVRTFQDYASCLTESLAAERPEAKRARVVVNGREHVQAALGGGRGAVVVTAHVGAWDAAARLLGAELGVRVALVMEAEPDPAARALHDDVRRGAGVEVFGVGEGPLDALPVLRHLRGGGVVAFQIDRRAPSGRGLDTTLFGRPFSIPEGPFRLAALAGVPLLAVFSSRTGYFAYEIEAGPPVECQRPIVGAELEAAAREVVGRLEAFIARHPTQWFHFGDGG